jgi:hypothetical protein
MARAAPIDMSNQDKAVIEASVKKFYSDNEELKGREMTEFLG